jgi:uncharacterized protein
MDLLSVRLEIPANANLILGQSHFIKTVEDLYEVVVNSVPGAKFAVAFSEASGRCLCVWNPTGSEGTRRSPRSDGPTAVSG